MDSQQFKVADGQSVRLARGQSTTTIVGGSTLPAGVDGEQILQWLAGGFIELVDDPEKLDLPKDAPRPEGPTTRELRLEAQAHLRKRNADRDEAAFAALGQPAAPVEPDPGEAMKPEGVWGYDPAELQGLGLEKLQIRIAEIAADRGLDVELPTTEDDCIALLSSERK